VSRRSKRRQGPQRGGAESAAEAGRAAQAHEAGSAASPRGRRGASRHAVSDWNLGVQLALLVAVFAVVVLVAELAGAANLGVALGVGQIALAIAVIYLLLRR
jgi:hypothetical protein